MNVTVCTSFPYESLNKLAVPNNLIQLEEIVLTLPANKTKMKTASQTRWIIVNVATIGGKFDKFWGKLIRIYSQRSFVKSVSGLDHFEFTSLNFSKII